MKERANASDVRPLMPSMTPFVSVEMICGTEDLTSEFALEEPDSSTPALFSQL